jgi:membrane associated rhomboid family serine protease
MSNIRSFSTLRARSYIFRLPLFTRGIIAVLALLWVLSVQSIWNVRAWGALIPDQVSFTAAYRLSTYPLVHLNFFHAFLNILALTPLVERFEREYGTLTSLGLFFGPLTTLPGVLYLIVDSVILRRNTAVMGASIWVFLLLGMEAMRTYRTNPYFSIGSQQIPTWTTPLAMVFVVAVMVPSTSLLGHLCGLGVGYVCGFGLLKYLAPPEWALRWIESRLNLLSILPHFVSVDQKTYGRFGVLPTSNRTGGSAPSQLVGGAQRLGP